MSDSDSAEDVLWAWAVLDRVIETDQDGFSEWHTLAIAPVMDPEEGEYLVGPDRVMRIAGDVAPELLMREWGWEEMGPWVPIDTKVLRPVETQIFGMVPPYRGVARVRRRGAETDSVAAEPVPYGEDLLDMFDEDLDPGMLDEMGAKPAPGSIAAAALVLDASGLEIDPEHQDEWQDAWERGKAGEEQSEDDQVRGYVFEAVRVLDAFAVWFAAEVREHGLPRAGTDDPAVCLRATIQAAMHPDSSFRLECLLAARHLAANGDIDPDHLVILERAALPEDGL